MSTASPEPASPVAPAPPRKREVLIVSHCSLFYWWPVWAVGFLLSLITLVSGHSTWPPSPREQAQHIGKVKMEQKGKKDGDPPTIVDCDALIAPPGTLLPRDRSNNALPEQPHIIVSSNKNLGVLFCVVLLLVITITNIPLRGLWSLIVLVFVFSLVVILALLDAWDSILYYLAFLDIRITAAGYFSIALPRLRSGC